MKILNLYAGIGGNRKLWGDEHEITAVEIDKDIAEIYRCFFPKDKVIVTDAHKSLLEHFEEFDFIWCSPPCPTHSRFNFLNNVRKEQGIKPKFPDMKLYEEIIFLRYWFKGNWLVENVIGYYEPLIMPYESGRHYFWSNFNITNKSIHNKVRNDRNITLKVKMKAMGMIVNNFYNYRGDKRKLLNNCVEPELGLHIFNCAFKEKQELLTGGLLPSAEENLIIIKQQKKYL